MLPKFDETSSPNDRSKESYVPNSFMPNSHELAALHILKESTRVSNEQYIQDDIEKDIETFTERFEGSDTYLYNLKQHMVHRSSSTSRSRSKDSILQHTGYQLFPNITAAGKYWPNSRNGSEPDPNKNQATFDVTHINDEDSRKIDRLEQEAIRKRRLTASARTQDLKHRGGRKT